MTFKHLSRLHFRIPTAKVQLPNGVLVTIEGQPDELVKITHLLSGNAEAKATPTKKSSNKSQSKKPKGLTDHVRALKAEGFFKTGKNLEQVKEALKSAGYIHSPNEISPVLLRLRRAGEIGRVQKDGAWIYTHRD